MNLAHLKTKSISAFISFWSEYKMHRLFNRWFWGGLALKVLIATLITSPTLDNWFRPFIYFFVEHPFTNPYQHFFDLAQYKSFPYCSLMLWLVSIPTLIFNFLFGYEFINLAFISNLLVKFPLIVADIGVYALLGILLPTHHRRIINFYWFSPLVIYINYYHGQLDIIPTLFFLLTLCLLFYKKDFWAFIVLGLGLATKLHLIAALPFLFVFAYFRHGNLVKPLFFSSLAIVIFLFLQLPYLHSSGFTQLVFLEEQKERMLHLFISFDQEGLKFLLAPAVIVFVLFRYVSLKTTNKDTFMLMMGLLFSAMVSVVPPMPGWFLWSLPFFVYFFAKYNETPRIGFVVFSIMYLVYFALQKHTDLLYNLHLLFPDFKSVGSPLSLLQNQALQEKIESLCFTLLEVSFLANILWIYRMGISSSSLIKKAKNSFTIGICGDSGSGKSTLAKTLTKMFGERNSLIIAGDDLHKWERGDQKWQELTHLQPLSNNLFLDIDHAQSLIQGQQIKRSFYNHETGLFSQPKAIEAQKYLIFQGLHTFFLKQMRTVLNLKIFMDTDKNLRLAWKIKRDLNERQQQYDKIIKQIETREQDSEKYVATQKQYANIVIVYQPVKAMSYEELVKTEDLPIKVGFGIDNSVSCDLLFNLIRVCCAQVQVQGWFSPEDDKFYFEVNGKIAKDQIEFIAARLVEQYSELLDHFPEWQEGYLGLCQLVVLNYYHQYLKYDLYSHR